MTTRVVIYARCSDTKQAEKELSIPAQLDACRAEAARHGWVVVQEFVDEGISGRTDVRPAFQDMIARSKENPRPFDTIMLWSCPASPGTASTPRSTRTCFGSAASPSPRCTSAWTTAPRDA